jgi:pyruvate/2-oxoacid:ferredoxin oxidoreductase beta subunit
MAKIEGKKILGIPAEEYFASGHRACAGCGQALAVRLVLKAAGKDTVVCNNTGCLEVFSSPYPETSWRVPWIHAAFENAAAVASGVERSFKYQGKKFNVLAVGGDGGTFDIGLQALSGAAERGHKFCYVCFDNGAYMNCLSTDSLIMTESGLKKITDIKIGEKVYAFDQNNHQLVLKKCTGIFDNGVKDVFELNTLHHSIKATSNHPFLTLKRNGRGKKSFFVWKNLENLEKNDEVVVLKGCLQGKSFMFPKIRFSQKGDFKVNKINDVVIPKISSPDLMEFFGLFVGDGWIRVKKAETGFALPKSTKESDRLIQLCKKLFRVNLIQKNRNYIYIYSVNLARFIDSLGFGKSAKDKIVPPWIFTLSLKEKEAFVKGLLSSDGYTIGKSCRYVSASIELLKSLRLLLQTLGYQVGKIHLQTKKAGTNVVYRKLLEDSTYGYVCFSKKRNADIKEYLSQTKQRDFLADNKFFSTEKIINIKFVKKEPTIDLRVEGEHNFVADGIIVHNTGIQRSGATPKYASTTTTPHGSKIHGKPEMKKDMPFIMAAHRAYVATASPTFPQDLVKKVQKGLNFDGPAYIQIDSVCTLGWGVKSDLTIQLNKLAYETRLYPLFEIENGILTNLMKPSKQIPIEECLKLQKRFSKLHPEEIKELQKEVDDYWNRLLKLEEIKVRLF